VPGAKSSLGLPERRLVQELPGFGTIKSPNPRCLNDRRIKVAEINPHPVSTAWNWLPVRYATTSCTSTQRKALVTPHVAVNVLSARGNLYFPRFVEAPQPTLTATDRAVATSKSPRLSSDLDLDCTAVGRPCKHGTALSVCGLTRALSRRAPANGARCRRRVSERACGAHALRPLGRLKRDVRPHLQCVPAEPAPRFRIQCHRLWSWEARRVTWSRQDDPTAGQNDSAG
jgi:hypothetical protein